MIALSLKDRRRRQKLENESFVRSYTRYGKKLQALTPEDETAMEFFNAIQRELRRERLKAVYLDDE